MTYDCIFDDIPLDKLRGRKPLEINTKEVTIMFHACSINSYIETVCINGLYEVEQNGKIDTYMALDKINPLKISRKQLESIENGQLTPIYSVNRGVFLLFNVKNGKQLNDVIRKLVYRNFSSVTSDTRMALKGTYLRNVNGIDNMRNNMRRKILLQSLKDTIDKLDNKNYIWGKY